LVQERSSFALVDTPSGVFAFGGSHNGLSISTYALFDDQIDGWVRLGDFPGNLYRSDWSGVWHAGFVWLVGGVVGPRPDVASVTGEVLRVEVRAQTFSDGPALPEALSSVALVAGPEGVLAIGGVNGGTIANSVYQLSREGDDWELIRRLQTPRWGHGAFLLDGQLVVVKGGETRSGPTANVECFSIMGGMP
jgi:hypothetical protein